MVFLDVLKLILDFFVKGKIWAGLFSIVLSGTIYLLFTYFAPEIAVMILVGLAIVGLLLNLPKLFKISRDREHAQSNAYRRAISKIIRHDLKKFLSKLGGHRIFVTEGHNGTSSLGDVAFLYMDITYLETIIPEDWINFEYRNMSVTIYPGFDWLAKHSTFAGDIEKLKGVDSRLAKIIKSNGTNYLIATCLYNAHNECVGAVILTFDKEPENPMEKAAEFQRLGNKIERLIDKQWSLEEVEKMAEDL